MNTVPRVKPASPESLFDDLIADFDRFSFITDDYNELEERFEGRLGFLSVGVSSFSQEVRIPKLKRKITILVFIFMCLILMVVVL